MKRLEAFVLIYLAAVVVGFTFAGDGSDGFVTGEDFTDTNVNQIDTALDDLQAEAALDDQIFVDSNAVSDLDILAGITISLNPGTGPDSISPEFNFTHTLASNPALEAEDCVPSRDGSGGGGFLCEGTVKNTNEQLFLFPATDGANTTSFIATAAAAVTDALSAAVAAATYQPVDADLTDLADGSLTGSKVGSGVSATNVTTGTLAVGQGGTGVGTHTVNAILKGNGTSGVVSSGVIVDASNNVSTTGTITSNAGGKGCLMLQDRDEGGWSECTTLDGTISCTIDPDGACDGV